MDTIISYPLVGRHPSQSVGYFPRTSCKDAAPFRQSERLQHLISMRLLETDQCTLSLTLTPQPDQMVLIELPLTCNGESSKPRLLARLGAKSSIRIGDAAKFTQIGVVVTH